MQVQSRFGGRKVDLGVAAYAAAMMLMNTFGFMSMGVDQEVIMTSNNHHRPTLLNLPPGPGPPAI